LFGNIADSRSIIIVGVGPFISSSLAHRLASQGWKIALLSRSQDKLDALAKTLKDKYPDVTVVTHAVDAGDVNAFLHALSESKAELCSVDVLCYNAARVGKLFKRVRGVQRLSALEI
jgi:short-subunit dehydrogenase